MRAPHLNITLHILGNILNIWLNMTPIVQIVTAPRNWQPVAEEIRTSVTCKPQRLSRTQLLRLAGAIPCSIVMEADGQRVPVQSVATNAMLVKTVNSWAKAGGLPCEGRQPGKKSNPQARRAGQSANMVLNVNDEGASVFFENLFWNSSVSLLFGYKPKSSLGI